MLPRKQKTQVKSTAKLTDHLKATKKTDTSTSPDFGNDSCNIQEAEQLE